jgi:hypothetical protein
MAVSPPAWPRKRSRVSGRDALRLREIPVMAFFRSCGLAAGYLLSDSIPPFERCLVPQCDRHSLCLAHLVLHIWAQAGDPIRAP